MNKLCTVLIRFLPVSMLVISTGTVGETHHSIDKRQTIQVNEMQRNHILTEMRSLLSGTQHILDALSKEDMKAVAHHARQLGMGMAHKGEDHLRSVLPPEFMRLGMSVHKDYDQIAGDAESVKDPKYTLGQMGKLMEKCNACHTTWQLRAENSTGKPDSTGAPPHHPHDGSHH